NPRFATAEFNFWPSSEAAFDDLAWLENVLGMSLGGVEVDMPPVTLNDNGPSAFVGFGDKTYSSIPAAAIFNRRANLELKFSPSLIYQRLFELCRNKGIPVHEYSEISQLRLSGTGV